MGLMQPIIKKENEKSLLRISKTRWLLNQLKYLNTSFGNWCKKHETVALKDFKLFHLVKNTCIFIYNIYEKLMDFKWVQKTKFFLSIIFLFCLNRFKNQKYIIKLKFFFLNLDPAGFIIKYFIRETARVELINRIRNNKKFQFFSKLFLIPFLLLKLNDFVKDWFKKNKNREIIDVWFIWLIYFIIDLIITRPFRWIINTRLVKKISFKFTEFLNKLKDKKKLKVDLFWNNFKTSLISINEKIDCLLVRDLVFLITELPDLFFSIIIFLIFLFLFSKVWFFFAILSIKTGWQIRWLWQKFR